jgi:hypothetical protein
MESNQELPNGSASFQPDELLAVVEVIEVALQAEKYFKDTKPSGVIPADHAALLSELWQVWQRASGLRSRMADGSLPVHLWHVWPLDQDGNVVASPSEFVAATATGALAQTAEMALADCPDVAGWKVIRAPAEARTYIGAAEGTESDA